MDPKQPKSPTPAADDAVTAVVLGITFDDGEDESSTQLGALDLAFGGLAPEGGIAVRDDHEHGFSTVSKVAP